MAPIGNPFHRQLWLQVGFNGETHVSPQGKSHGFSPWFLQRGKSHRDFCRKNLWDHVTKEWSNWNECSHYAGITYATATQEKKIQQRKGSHCRNNYPETKELGTEGMPTIGMLPPKQQQRKAVTGFQPLKWRAVTKQWSFQNKVSTKQCFNMFQQKKLAKELANCTDVRNTALEQLGYKSKKKRSSRCRSQSCDLGCQIYWTKTKVSLTYSVLLGTSRAPSSSCCQNATALAREPATRTWRARQYCCSHEVQVCAAAILGML